ncbi:MAG: hypothetical protein EZS28_001340 [Streblomastix strix]|uniref:Uncharacterized protein n=1 Tax=Streblomastix strix TaxID=222440 RepID=A0A5J4X7I6_9EUKA|nr:MAG: hypothetical protein EZS28_001340 [Streblomastix strix]
MKWSFSKKRQRSQQNRNHQSRDCLRTTTRQNSPQGHQLRPRSSNRNSKTKSENFINPNNRRRYKILIGNQLRGPQTRNPINKILQNEQALALYNFRKDEGKLAHLYEPQEEQLAIGLLSLMINNLWEAERTYFARAQNENGTNANYLNLAANSIS